MIRKRRKKQKFKNRFLNFIIIMFFSMSIGYATLTQTLAINGVLDIKENTWDIHFENVQTTSGSVPSKTFTINNDNLSIVFSAGLELPGDFYEFSVDVVNKGTLDAVLDSIEKTPELTTTQAKYLIYTVEYQNGEQFQKNQLLNKDSFVRIKIRVEYREDMNLKDMPATTDTLNLSLTLNYVQSEDNGILVKNNGASVQPTANGSLDEIGTIVTIGDQQFYTIGTEGDNVKLLSMYNLYVGNECDYTSSNSCTSYGGEATGKQDSTMLGYVFDEQGEIVRKGTTAFSSDTQKGTNYSDYSGSIVEGYVNAYKEILEGKEYGIDVVEARLITKEELTSNDIGCSEGAYTCLSAPSFIYSTSYWTGSNDYVNYVWYVYNTGRFYDHGDYSIDDAYGVRPVIIIPKSSF